MKQKIGKIRTLLRRYYHRMVSERGTPEYIARGWAVGVFVGWMIPVGLQMVVSLPLALLFRGSKLGAVVGTCITNPVTILVIYPAQCYLGNLITGGSLSYGELEVSLKELIEERTFAALGKLSREILVDFALGGLVFAILTTPIAYVAVRSAVIAFRAKLAAHRRKKNPGV
ncbi:MAG: DUF2062 domain-containing protein [Victivallaceae bacterium]